MHGLLTQTCDIERATRGTDDAYGQPALSWSVVGDDVPCRFEAKSGREEDDDIQAAITTHVVYLAGSGDSIDEDDRIVYGGQTYEVRNVREVLGLGASVHHVEVDVEAVEIG